GEGGCQSAGLLCSRNGEAIERVLHLTGRAAVSSRKHFVLHPMQANHTRTVGVLEVATDRVLNHRAQLFEGIGLRENGMAQGARFKTTFGRFLDGKNYFRRRSLLGRFSLHFRANALIAPSTA